MCVTRDGLARKIDTHSPRVKNRFKQQIPPEPTRDTFQAVAEPLGFGMEEPWGDGSWGYPKAQERSISIPLKSSRGPSGPFSAASSAVVKRNSPKKEMDQPVESPTVSKFLEARWSTLSKFFTGGGGVHLRRQKRRIQ